jgi:hypothetical protein
VHKFFPAGNLTSDGLRMELKIQTLSTPGQGPGFLKVMEDFVVLGCRGCQARQSSSTEDIGLTKREESALPGDGYLYKDQMA